MRAMPAAAYFAGMSFVGRRIRSWTMRAHWMQFIARLAVAILVGFASHVRAEEKKDPGGAGNVDTKASRVYVLVGKEGIGHEHGVEGQLKEGTVQLGKDSEAGQIVFDLASFESDTE